MGELIVKRWESLGWNEEDSIETILIGPPPEFLTILHDTYESYFLTVAGTDFTQINKLVEIFSWFNPETLESAKDYLLDIDGFYEKSFSVQWYEDLFDRLARNHISVRDNILIFREEPVELELLGIKEVIVMSNSDIMLTVCDGVESVNWTWDSYWGGGRWEKHEN